MFFRYTLTVPANTAETSPVELYCDLTHGVITGVWVGFPAGCAGLAKARIYRYEHQAWPLNTGGYFAWDNYVFHFEENYELFQPPYEVLIRAWNDDECYEHEVMVCFEVFITPMPFLQRILGGIFGGPGEGGE